MKTYRIILSLIMLTLLIFPLSGCKEKVVQAGDIVKVHYKGTLDDGAVFDSSEGRDPLEFTAGGGEMIKGFDDAVIGMKVGEVKTVTLPPEDAYGNYDEEMLLVYPIDKLPEGVEPSVGDYLQVSQSDGGVLIVPVVEVTETTITVDANHRLAGKELTFTIELVELIRE